MRKSTKNGQGTNHEKRGRCEESLKGTKRGQTPLDTDVTDELHWWHDNQREERRNPSNVTKLQQQRRCNERQSEPCGEDESRDVFQCNQSDGVRQKDGNGNNRHTGRRVGESEEQSQSKMDAEETEEMKPLIGVLRVKVIAE